MVLHGVEQQCSQIDAGAFCY